MHDDTLAGGEAAAAGISRRDLLRKGAVVGGAGALLWAAPSITKFGGAAFGAEGTPITGFSYAAAIVRCDGTEYRVKYERDEGGFEDDPGNLPHCNSGAFTNYFENCWGNAVKAKYAHLPFTVSVSQSGDFLYFDLGSDYPHCEFINCGGQGGVIQGGTICDSSGISVIDGGQRVRFDTSKVK